MDLSAQAVGGPAGGGGGADEAARLKALASMSDTVRAHIQTLTYLRACAAASQRRP